MSGDGRQPGVLRLTVELFLLPVRTFVHAMKRMVETLDDIQRITDRGADSLLGSGPRGDDRRPVPPWPAAVDSAPWAGSEPESFREPPTAGGVRDGAGEQSNKEDNRMYLDQDLSGDMVKVVQYCIVSVFTDAGGNARVISKEPRIKAFSNDMTAEDFTSWMMAEHSDEIHKCKKAWMAERGHDIEDAGPTPFHTKYLRVAFSVMGRFSPADIDWTELQTRYIGQQARHVHRIAANFPPPGLPEVEKEKKGKAAKGGS